MHTIADDDDSGAASRVPADDHGGTCGRVIDLSNPHYRLMISHTLGEAQEGALMLLDPRETPERYVAVRGCPDCTGQPRAMRWRPAGYDAHVLVQHDGTCPALRRAFRDHGEEP